MQSIFHHCYHHRPAILTEWPRPSRAAILAWQFSSHRRRHKIAQSSSGALVLSTVTDISMPEANGSSQASMSTPNGARECPSKNMCLHVQCPTLLMQEDFYCPFLHCTLFD
ncbi:hypothetical protein BDW62DRAFT_52956 [Aspergillus aurantiobrunneus]